jgi:hypothetical protein
VSPHAWQLPVQPGTWAEMATEIAVAREFTDRTIADGTTEVQKEIFGRRPGLQT